MKRIGTGKRTDSEDGMIVVEAALSLTVFVWVVAALLSFGDIYLIHSKVQYAINSAAHEIASLSYLLEATGVHDADLTLQANTAQGAEPITHTAADVADTVESGRHTVEAGKKLWDSGGNMMSEFQNFGTNIGSLFDPSGQQGRSDVIEATVGSAASLATAWGDFDTDFNDGMASAKDTLNKAGIVVNDFKDLGRDPASLGRAFLQLAVGTGDVMVKYGIGQLLAWALTKSYIDPGSRANANEWLLSAGVVDGYKGLYFNGSAILVGEDSHYVDIVVQYDVDMKFAALFVPDGKIHLLQRVTVPCWLDGDGGKVPTKLRHTSSDNQSFGGT